MALSGRDGSGKNHHIGALSDAERKKRAKLEQSARVERLKDKDGTSVRDLEVLSRRRKVNDPEKS